MPAPTQQQARRHHADQAAIAAAAAIAVRRLMAAGRGWDEILSTIAAYQLAAVTAALRVMLDWLDAAPQINPVPFAGVSSAGFAISEPLVATIDRYVPAPAEDLPAAWWDDHTAFIRSVEQLIASEVQDAARSAVQAEMVMQLKPQKYVRMLQPPSCKRCVILAGRTYIDLEEFDRHPGCDCLQVPVEDWETGHDIGLVSSPEEAFEKGYIRDLTIGERQAIADGADIITVINSSSGISTANLFGHRTKLTSYGTTKRSAWRRQNPSRLVRLRPESIYDIAGDDRAEAVRLLKLYGYIT